MKLIKERIYKEEKIKPIKRFGSVKTKIFVNKKKYKLKEGDVSWIPPKVPHRFFNTQKRNLKIYWTYANINATRTDVLTGKTNKIMDEHKK